MDRTACTPDTTNVTVTNTMTTKSPVTTIATTITLTMATTSTFATTAATFGSSNKFASREMKNINRLLVTGRKLARIDLFNALHF